MKAIEHHQKLRRRQERMQRNATNLDAEVQMALQSKLLIEMNLQVFRQAEWEANHPVREAGTQVAAFQLEEPPQYIALPVMMSITPPASPEDPRLIIPPSVTPAREMGALSRRKMVAVVHGYSHSQRAFIDNDYKF